jgi:hypothetical protein
MNYQTVEQLLADDGFLAWYHQTDDNQVATWNAWIASDEENRLLAAEAVLFLKELKLLEDEKIGKAYKKDIWEGFKSRIGVKTC